MKHLAFLAIFVHLSAQAFFVNPEFGNVTNTSIDCQSKNKTMSLFIERFFNSSAKQIGWFGVGYGSTFETYLHAELDGSLTLHDYGQTPGRVFLPKSKPIDPSDMIEKIIAKKASSVHAGAVAALRKRLNEDRQYRVEQAREVGLTAKPSDGAVFESKLYDGEVITFSKGVFVKQSYDGKRQVFSESGKLLETYDERTKQRINLAYDSKGLVKSISDNFSNQLNLTWDLNGRVVSVASVVDGKSAQYAYQGNNLVRVTNQKADTYLYEFDSQRNLIKLTYPNNSFIRVSYDPKTRQPKVVNFSDNSKTEYAFETKPIAGGTETHSLEKKFSADGATESEKRWIYRFSSSPLGSRQMKYQSFSDGLTVTETFYRPCCYPQPEKIVSGSDWAEFGYDAENRLVSKKHSSGRTLAISYDEYEHISIVKADGVEYRFKHHPQTAELLEFQTPDYRLKLGYRGGFMSEVTLQKGEEKALQRVDYSYDKSGRLVGIKFNDKILVNYTYNGGNRSAQFPGPKAQESEKLLREIDGMMLDMMVINEINYSL